MVQPAHAHKTEVSGDIAGTWHVDPDHSPIAGEPAQIWIALTQRGGIVIPLDQCDCQLSITQGDSSEAAPVLTPPLEAIAVEQYQGIPGANFVFPDAGQYQLVLTGQPKNEASFQPFQLSYTVSVGVGSPSSLPESTPTAPNQNSHETSSSAENLDTADSSGDRTTPSDASPVFIPQVIVTGAIAGLAGAVFAGKMVQRRRESDRNSKDS